MIGQSIAHYRIVKQIGVGGMGQVFLAADTKLDRRVAIKVLLSPNPNESQIGRFHREAKAAAALNHPNIVSIHELAARAAASYMSPLSLASIPLMLGRVDEAVERFEHAFAERDPVLITTTAWPLFSRARKEPRVQALFERMGVRWTP